MKRIVGIWNPDEEGREKSQTTSCIPQGKKKIIRPRESTLEQVKSRGLVLKRLRTKSASP